MGTPNREPNKHIKNIVGIYLPGSLHTYYVPTIFSWFRAWGPHYTPFSLGVGLRDRGHGFVPRTLHHSPEVRRLR